MAHRVAAGRGAQDRNFRVSIETRARLHYTSKGCAVVGVLVCLAESILECNCPVCFELCTETAGVESLVQCIEASGRLPTWKAQVGGAAPDQARESAMSAS